ncbi:helix-turn-helix transcriptional regulator [Corynebacterium sp. AOP36-E1-14]
MTTKQVAEYIGSPNATVHSWRHREVGPDYFRVQGRVYYWKSDIDHWLTEQGATA